MKYFTHDQYDDLIIVDLDFELPDWQAPYYEALTEEQLEYLENNQQATPTDVKYHDSTPEATPEYSQEDIDAFRENVKLTLSEISLSAAKAKVPDYKVLNAQMSLLVADGTGIYSHSDAEVVIANYNEIGTICRNKYYEFVDKLAALNTMEEIQALNDEAVEYFNSL